MDYHQIVIDAQNLFEYTQKMRRDFHQNPELGFKEFRTSEIVAKELRALDLKIRTGVGETGVIGFIEGSKTGPVVMLRFDMDALPIDEVSNAEYRSNTPGVMHACGHDGHTAVGLTVARLLHARRSEWNGTVMLLFQPAEEGLGGAARMIEDGALDDPKPDFTMGLHLENEEKVGWFGLAPGPIMAAAEKFKITMTGKGGHGAEPQVTYDPVVASAQMIMSVQSIVSRNISPLKAGVVSITMVHGGDAFNIIPSKVELQGTIRTFEPEVRSRIVDRLSTIVSSTAQALGCTAQLEVTPLTPAVVNFPEEMKKIQDVAVRLFPNSAIENNYHSMGSEDMAFFMEKVQGCFMLIGSKNSEKGLDSAHHHPSFDFDEQALSLGAALMAASTLNFLNVNWD